MVEFGGCLLGWPQEESFAEGFVEIKPFACSAMGACPGLQVEVDHPHFRLETEESGDEVGWLGSVFVSEDEVVVVFSSLSLLHPREEVCVVYLGAEVWFGAFRTAEAVWDRRWDRRTLGGLSCAAPPPVRVFRILLEDRWFLRLFRFSSRFFDDGDHSSEYWQFFSLSRGRPDGRFTRSGRRRSCGRLRCRDRVLGGGLGSLTACVGHRTGSSLFWLLLVHLLLFLLDVLREGSTSLVPRWVAIGAVRTLACRTLAAVGFMGPVRAVSRRFVSWNA